MAAATARCGGRADHGGRAHRAPARAPPCDGRGVADLVERLDAHASAGRGRARERRDAGARRALRNASGNVRCQRWPLAGVGDGRDELAAARFGIDDSDLEAGAGRATATAGRVLSRTNATASSERLPAMSRAQKTAVCGPAASARVSSRGCMTPATSATGDAVDRDARGLDGARVVDGDVEARRCRAPAGPRPASWRSRPAASRSRRMRPAAGDRDRAPAARCRGRSRSARARSRRDRSAGPPRARAASAARPLRPRAAPRPTCRPSRCRARWRSRPGATTSGLRRPSCVGPCDE